MTPPNDTTLAAAQAEVRSACRQCLACFARRWPDAARKVVARLEPAAQKAIAAAVLEMGRQGQGQWLGQGQGQGQGKAAGGSGGGR